MHPNNKLTINVVEAAPLEDFSLEVRYLYHCSDVYCAQTNVRLYEETSRKHPRWLPEMVQRLRRRKRALK